jgi:phosphodiester glycosidase
VIALILAALLVWLAVSMGMTLTNPAYGTSISARLAEWARQNHGGGLVNWIENEWYSHHPPPVGGKPPPGAIVRPKTPPTVAVSGPAHLAPPSPMNPLASPAIAGEGQWSPVGRTVDGIPAVYETTLRPDPVHTSEVAGVAWMDTELLRATLYSGSQIPGPGNYSHTAPILPTDATSLATAFNAGFLMSQANGGYYTDGRTVIPLVDGAASFVVYRNGNSTVGQWGRDLSLTPDVVSVRQNLDLLVDQGQPVPGLQAADTTRWGFTLGNAVFVWRSGLGVTANGALVYVGGPGLNITDLANLLVDAGSVRAMELDINTSWVNFASYTAPAGAAASPANGSNLIAGMSGGTSRYFQPYWSRDFITMSVR